jgi:hypothetical protein
MAAQTHAQSQSSCDSAPYPCLAGFQVDTFLDYDDSGETVTPEESFQATCCYSDCAAVQTANGYLCFPGTVNYGQGKIAHYGDVSHNQGFQDTCCATSCSQIGMQCSAGKELISTAADVAFGDDSNQFDFDFICCEDKQLTCAAFQTTYNDPVQGNQDLQCTGTVQDSYIEALFEVEFLVPAYKVTAATDFTFTYNEFTNDNGVQKTHAQVQADFNNACCVCNVGATISVDYIGLGDSETSLIYEIPGLNPPECSSIWIEQLKGIKEATDAAGDALTSTCALAET